MSRCFQCLTKPTFLLPVLAATGVGLLFFSVMSLGYARSSEKDAKVLDQAVSGLARSLQPSHRLLDRVWTALTIPFRAVGSAASALFTTFLLPFHFVQYTVARIDYTRNAANKAMEIATTWTLEQSSMLISRSSGWVAAIRSALGSTSNVLGNVLWGTMDALATALGRVASCFGGVKNSTQHSVQSTNSWLARLSRTATTRAWVSLNAISQWLGAIHGYLTSFVGFLSGVDRKTTNR